MDNNYTNNGFEDCENIHINLFSSPTFNDKSFNQITLENSQDNEISTNTNEANNLNLEHYSNEQIDINNNAKSSETNDQGINNISGNESGVKKIVNEMRNDSFHRSIINNGFKIYFNKYSSELEKLAENHEILSNLQTIECILGKHCSDTYCKRTIDINFLPHTIIVILKNIQKEKVKVTYK